MKAQLKQRREAYKQFPTLRKTYRKYIAAGYLKKLQLQEKLESVNRSTIRNRKLEIKTLTAEVKRLVSFGEGLKRRVEELEGLE
ncbi:MAG: hypothetical protein EOP48_08600 [Sphingobacteriales bacterium]|nr:MAG: hypothetical protein EOP48_08600 [Sphingobacteriales bacterium]